MLLRLVFGAPRGRAGSLMGIGIEMGGRRQLLRMDANELNLNHGGTSGTRGNEHAVIKGNISHMHVLKWDGAIW